MKRPVLKKFEIFVPSTEKINNFDREVRHRKSTIFHSSTEKAAVVVGIAVNSGGRGKFMVNQVSVLLRALFSYRILIVPTTTTTTTTVNDGKLDGENALELKANGMNQTLCCTMANR